MGWFRSLRVPVAPEPHEDGAKLSCSLYELMPSWEVPAHEQLR